MSHAERFSVSLDPELLAAFDHYLTGRGYDNRSEAVRDMIRELLVTGRLEHGTNPVLGVMTVVCDHRVSGTANRLRTLLAAQTDLVRGTLHVPLDEHRDVLAIALKGPSERTGRLANTIQAMRGTALGHLSMIPLRE